MIFTSSCKIKEHKLLLSNFTFTSYFKVHLYYIILLKNLNLNLDKIIIGYVKMILYKIGFESPNNFNINLASLSLPPPPFPSLPSSQPTLPSA